MEAELKEKSNPLGGQSGVGLLFVLLEYGLVGIITRAARVLQVLPFLGLGESQNILALARFETSFGDSAVRSV